MPNRPDPTPDITWLSLLQLGVTSTLAVLFVVLLARSREQGVEMRQLQTRLQALESNQSLEKAADQSGQLRILSQRLQHLETGQAEAQERSDAERTRLQKLLLEWRSQTRTPATPGTEEAAEALPAPHNATGAPTGVLKPSMSSAAGRQ